MQHYWMRRKFSESESGNYLHLVRDDGELIVVFGTPMSTVNELQTMADERFLNLAHSGHAPGRDYMKGVPGVKELYVRPRWLRRRVYEDGGYVCMEAVRSDGYLYFARGPVDTRSLMKKLRSKLDSFLDEIPEVNKVPLWLGRGCIGWVEEPEEQAV